MSERQNLKILVVDDHDLVRAGVSEAARSLAQNTIIHSVACIADALVVCAKEQDLDLILLDLALPDAEGFSGLDAILDCLPDAPVILLTADCRKETMEEAFLHGASGYIPKSSNMTIIVNALNIILAGGRYLPGEMLNSAPRVIAGGSAKAVNSRFDIVDAGVGDTDVNNSTDTEIADFGLTSRQRAVARLLSQGLSNKEICRELGLSISTVKTHVASILRALRTSSRAGAAAILASEFSEAPKSRS